MSKFHRILSWLLLLGMTVLPACTSTIEVTDNSPDLPETAAPQATPSPSPTVASYPEEEALPDIELPEEIDLVLWHSWSGSLKEMFEGLIDDFNQTNQWGIHVTTQAHGDEMVYLDDIGSAYEAGELPDLAAAPSQFLRLWYRAGVPIVDLNEFIGSDIWGFSQAQMNAFLPTFWNADVAGDVRLGIPAYRNGHFLFYNQSWAKDLGFDDYPKTSAEFAEQACAAAELNLYDETYTNNGTGGWIYAEDAITSLSWLEAFSGADFIDADGNINFEMESNQAALEYLYDLYVDDCAWTGKQSTPYKYFSDRYALFYSGDSDDILVQEASDEENNNADDWRLIPYPSDENRPVVYVDGYSYAILSDDPDRSLAAWLFLRYMISSDIQVKIVESTGAMPLSNTAIHLLEDFRADHSAWDQILQFIPVAQSTPPFAEWVNERLVFSDMLGQLKFTVTKENIPDMLTEASAIVQGLKQQDNEEN